MSLSIVLNGQQRMFEMLHPPVNLAQLIAELQLKGDRIAVELNGEIVQRALWPSTPMTAGDRLEVVHFVGGGCVTNPN
jgi:sulfur carrier protein